jgi:hypothetical protein
MLKSRELAAVGSKFALVRLWDDYRRLLRFLQFNRRIRSRSQKPARRQDHWVLGWPRAKVVRYPTPADRGGLPKRRKPRHRPTTKANECKTTAPSPSASPTGRFSSLGIYCLNPQYGLHSPITTSWCLPTTVRSKNLPKETIQALPSNPRYHYISYKD